MILGLGIDVVSIARIARILVRHGRRFRARCFTPAECAACDRYGAGAAAHFAARFAAKEAASKCLGTGIGVIGWRELAVAHRDTGAPYLRLEGAAAARAAVLGITHLMLSLSHEAGVAVAVVIGQGQGPGTPAPARPAAPPAERRP